MSLIGEFSGAFGRRLGRLVGPRPWPLVAAGLVALGLVVAFTFVVLESQAKSRREAERFFASEAGVMAQLTASLFASSVSSTQAQASKTFGGSTPDANALAALVKRSRLAYASILASDGSRLAASRGAPPPVVPKPAANQNHVGAALGGRPWLSAVGPGTSRVAHVVEWAIPFDTPRGRRVLVEGLNANVLYGFFRGYLDSADRSPARRAYVVDGRNVLIASSDGGGKLGDRLAGPLVRVGNGRFGNNGVDSYVVSAPLQGSDWRVLLSEPTSALYGLLSGSRRWVVFAVLAAFALAAAVSLVLLRGVFVAAARLAKTNRDLAEVNTTLEERVAARTALAQQRTEDLARSNAELEQFASVASHDLQEPLRKIRMYCERLPRRLGDDLSEEAAMDMTRMEHAAHRMQRLIDDLLSFARVTSKDREVELVDLGQVTRDVISDLEARVTELDALIDVGDLPAVEASRAQMRQLMQNLVSNALKFHRDGVRPIVRIRADVVAAQPSRFRGEAAVGACYAITVNDNGIGFDAKYAERIFSAFERLHSRSDYEGTGIGLSIARKIAWRHHGDIQATSVPGQGSTFTLIMPLPVAASGSVEEAA